MPHEPKVYATRTIEFAAAHRLYREDWSEEKNHDVFGQCANPFGHGHNYLLEACFLGSPDPETGMVVHFNQLKKVLFEMVEAPMDHRHLNHDVAFMEGILPTSENMILAIWQRIEGAIKGQPFGLHRLTLHTSARNRVEYYGPDGAPSR